LIAAEECAAKCVDLAAPIAESPRSTIKEIVAGRGDETYDKAEISDGQVHDQRVGWCSQ